MLHETDDDGFTVVEALVALALTGLAIATLLSAFPTVQRSLHSVARAADAMEDRLALRAAVALLEKARASRLQQFYGQGAARSLEGPLEGSKQSIRFVAEFAGTSGYGGIYAVAMDVEDDKTGSGARLLLRRSHVQSGTDDVPELPRIVIDRARAISFAYAEVSPDGILRWQETWKEPDRLPHSVRLQIQPLAGTTGPLEVSARLELRR